MPLSLTCDCGARFEVEDTLAGQSVSCPECQQTLKAPAAQRPVVRTSNFALASFLLAIVGAFTVVGTLAAVVLGVIAVASILRDRERLAGLGFAFTGILLGAAFSALTLWTLSTGELFGFGGAMRRAQMADQFDDKVDPKTPQDITENGFRITKPAKWQRAKKTFQFIPVQPLLRGDALLLLVEPDLYAFVDVAVEADAGRIDNPRDYILSWLKPDSAPRAAPRLKPPPGKPNPPPDDEGETDLARMGDPTIQASRDLGRDPGFDVAYEATVSVTLDGKPWTVLVRAYQKHGGPLYLVRGFAEASRFARAKDDLLKVLDSFAVSPGP